MDTEVRDPGEHPGRANSETQHKGICSLWRFFARTTASPPWVPRAARTQRRELELGHISVSNSVFSFQGDPEKLRLYNDSGDNFWPLSGGRVEIRNDGDSA